MKTQLLLYGFLIAFSNIVLFRCEYHTIQFAALDEGQFSAIDIEGINIWIYRPFLRAAENEQEPAYG